MSDAQPDEDATPEIDSKGIAHKVILITGVISISSLFVLDKEVGVFVFGLTPLIALSAGFIAYAYLELFFN